MALNFFCYNNSESFDRYRKEIADIPLLSEEDEKVLGDEAKRGSLEARDTLVNSLLKFVVSIARNYKNRGVALEDLVSEGNIGLLYAVEGFDPNEGRLSTYSSYWIKKAINDAIREKTGITHTDTPTDRFENYRTRIKEKLNSAKLIRDNHRDSWIRNKIEE
ncbi:MAG: sigma-70 family RNA polymerase sigma factor [Sphaerochaetaceae bacterium]|nr:sigma-70 family RNA polymerase sigma factor [Sphaerochaetaceae bacterium]